VNASAAGLLLAGGCRWGGVEPDSSGTIECTTVAVAPEVAGRLLEVAAVEGAAVRQGDLVAQLDATAYRLRADEARALLAQAEAARDLATAGAREEDVQRAREQVREAQAAAWAATQDLARVQQVFEAGSATAKQFDDARAAAERSGAALAAAEQQLAKLLRGSRQEEIRMAQAAADQARARAAQAEKAVADCRVTAPLDGVVTVKSAEAGEFVGPGAVLARIARLDEVWLAVYVPERRLASLRVGQPARVTVDGHAGSFAGIVTFVASEAEFSPKNVQTRDERAKLMYRVKVTLPNPDGVFKPGMPADVYLESDGAGHG
jgi:HlyD family secretion protein